MRNISLIYPGSTHDSAAYVGSDLGILVSQGKLPMHYWFVLVDAYSCTEQTITPYPGRGLDDRKDAFNFYQSSTRIKIECCFGLLVARWGILWREIKLRIDKVPLLMEALCKLHNMRVEDFGLTQP